ncbi:MAG: hypothetical protein ACFFFG_03910 [Candidatus Thorarchaeota archaeon]
MKLEGVQVKCQRFLLQSPILGGEFRIRGRVGNLQPIAVHLKDISWDTTQLYPLFRSMERKRSLDVVSKSVEYIKGARHHM